MLRRILPRQPEFFAEFDRHAAVTVEAARVFSGLLEDYTNLIGKTTKIKELEHEGDAITHRTIELLHTTFITPIDREQIHILVSRLDDILDAIEAAAVEFTTYEIEAPTPASRDLAKLLVNACEEVQHAVSALRDLKHPGEIRRRCVGIKSFENQGDAVLLDTVARLFKEEKDPIKIIKWRDIYNNLEDALDRCEDVANVIETILMEHA